MLDKLKRLRADHLKIQHNLTFYPYQERISDEIIKALLDNLRITAGATEKDVKKLKQVEVAIELSRQAGKTYAVGHTCEFIITFLPVMFGRPIRIGIFAAQIDQAKISYGIMRNSLRKAKATIVPVSFEEQQYIKEEENAKKLVLPDGSSATVAPINLVSQIEGLSLDLIIIDEAQVAKDKIVKHSIWPMGKVTNAPRIYIGKAGTQINHFYRLSQRNDTIKVYFDDVVKQRKQIYDLTGDPIHLIYEQSVRSDIAEHGIDADEIQREYFGKWQIGTGQFTTQEQLEALEQYRRPTFQFNKAACFAGIDTAKHPDSTVVTILREPYEGSIDPAKKDLLNWIELRGDNYQDQFDIILAFLKNYRVEGVAIDSTGQGDFMPDLFEKHTEWGDENSGLYRINFSAVSKDLMYKNLKVSIKESLTTIPNRDTRLLDRFKQQMLDLQQQYKGQLLSVKHPDDPNAHDDYPDSWALAEWAYAKYNENQADISVVKVEKERPVAKDANNKVTDHWPGDENW